jgi:hypothetical protein
MMPAATLAAWSDPAPGTASHWTDGKTPLPCSTCGKVHHADLPVFDLRTQRVVPVVTGHEVSGYIPFDFPPLVRGRNGKITRAAQFDLFA